MSCDHNKTTTPTYLTSECDKHREVLLVVPDDHTVAEQLYLVHHLLLDGNGGNVLTTPGDKDLLDTTSDVQVSYTCVCMYMAYRKCTEDDTSVDNWLIT